MVLKNIKYVLVGENDEPIKNEDGSFTIKTAEVILENVDDIEGFNASNLENSNQQINELQTKNTELVFQLKQIEVNNFINSLTDNEGFKNVLLKSYDINDDIEAIKTHLQIIFDELIKVQTVNTGGVTKSENKVRNIIDTDNVFNK